MVIDTSSELMTATQWEKAHAIARDLVETETDVNELEKAMAYLRSAIKQDQSKAGTQFFKFLRTLVGNGNKVGHSGRTIDYYDSLEKACIKHLQSGETSAQSILQILGWAARLMRYYKVTPVGEESENSQEEPTAISERRAAIEKLKTTQLTEPGQIMDAEVIKKNPKGSKVTYLMVGIAFTEKETKTFDVIPETGMVKVKIVSLKADGSINHIKYAEPCHLFSDKD
jgi:hypothetical protein